MKFQEIAQTEPETDEVKYSSLYDEIARKIPLMKVEIQPHNIMFPE